MTKHRLRRNASFALTLCCSILFAAASGCGPGGNGTPTTFSITFSLATTPAPLDSLKFKVAYQGGGGFDGQGTSVQCTRLGAATGAASTFDDDDIATLTIDLTAGNTAMDAVSQIVSCLFSAKVQPTTENFAVTVTEALDENGDDVKNQAQVLVASIVEDSGGGNSTDHFVTFRVTDTETAVSALQFDVDFTGSQGAFAVSGQKPDCTNLAGNSVLAANIIDGRLSAGLISLTGFDTPADVLRCRFMAVTAPVAGDFDITVMDAMTVPGDSINPAMSVSSITTGSAQ